MSGLEHQAAREELHLLLDRIPDSDVATARKFLRALADPVKLALLNAPLDTEPMSGHERAAWEADARRRQSCEAPLSGEEVLRDLGISESDLR